MTQLFNGVGQKTGLPSLTPSESSRYHDPVEYLDFGRPITEAFLPYDTRSATELIEVARGHASALERERALWELADRDGEAALPLITELVTTEQVRSVRQGMLWLAMRSAGPRSGALLEGQQDDDDPEVADWARVLLADVTGVAADRVYSSAEVEETGYFDQTVPLVISGKSIIQMPGVGSLRAVLSPLWFDSILGRVLASTNTSTVRHELTVEKELEGLHADGTNHYEIYPFRGLSTEYEAGRYLEHNYLSETMRPFYESGIVDSGPATMVPVSLSRIALTELASKGEVEIHGDGARAERMRAADRPFIKSVRGRFFGWAAINLAAVFDAGMVKAGHVQLSNPTDPVAGPATNARLYGTFRGKSGDYTGAGRMTLNTIKCHGRPDGGIDTVVDGAEFAGQ